MHRIKTSTRSRKAPLLALLGVFILLAGAAYAAYTHELWPFTSRQSEAEKQEAANSSDRTNIHQKKDTPSSEELARSGADKTTDEIPVAPAGNLDITTLEQRNGTIVYAGAFQNIATGGTCSALFEHVDGAARPVTRTSPTNGSSCPEITIPQTEFVALGEWKLTLRYYVSSTQLVTTKTLEVK